jgi:hypothetical protein
MYKYEYEYSTRTTVQVRVQYSVLVSGIGFQNHEYQILVVRGGEAPPGAGTEGSQLELHLTR